MPFDHGCRFQQHHGVQGRARPLLARPIAEIVPAEILTILKRIEKSGRRATARRLRGGDPAGRLPPRRHSPAAVVREQLLLALEDIEQAVAGNQAADDKKDPVVARTRGDKRRSNRGAFPAHLPHVD